MIARSVWAAVVGLLLTFPALADAPRVAIIIDDLGYQLQAGRRAIALPGPLAYAVLPGTPQARALASAAHHSGKEVLLHLPLEAVRRRDAADPASITLDMTREGLLETFTQALDSVPFAAGVNTHRGSLLTQHPEHMRWLMEAIGRHDGLFFVDSYTTHLSVALQVAREAGLEATRRDVFLDPDPSYATIAKNFERMKTLARQRGAVVAIGHPYPTTLEFLERELPHLANEGIELVPLRALLGNRTPTLGAPMNERTVASQ